MPRFTPSRPARHIQPVLALAALALLATTASARAAPAIDGPSLSGDGPKGPRLPPDAAQRFAETDATLRAQLAALRGAPDRRSRRAALRNAQASAAALLSLIDAAHHAADLVSPEARVTALALRPLLAQARSAETGLWVLVDDVWLLRPEIYDTFADTALALGDAPTALRARIHAAAADGGSPARLERAAAALAAAGEAEAAAVMARRAKLAAGEADPKP